MSPTNGAIEGPVAHSRSHRVRNALLLLVILGIGFLGGSLERASRMEQQRTEYTDAALQRVADQYFSAINQLLETGDSAPLAQVLDDRFVGYMTGSETTIGKSALIDQLLLLRAVAPDVRVRFAVSSTSESTFAADVDFTGAIPESYGGFVLTPANELAAFELLTLRDGKIVERRGAPFAPLPIHQASTATIEVDPDRLTVATLRRWTLAPRSTVRGSFPYPLVVVSSSDAFVVETASDHLATALQGQPGIAMEDGHDDLTRTGTPAEMHAGGAILLPADTPFTMRNALDRDLQLIVVELVMKPDDAAPPTFLEGLESTMLARGATVERGNTQLTVTVARLELDPQGHWLGGRVPGSGELVAVASGSIEIRAAPGTVWTVGQAGRIVGETAPVQVLGQHGAAIDGALVVTYRAIGLDPADIWVVGLSPAS